MRLLSYQRGVALVENALTMAVFLMVVMAIIEFSLLMYVWSRGAEAARSASRFAIVSDAILNLDDLDCEEGGETTEISSSCDGNSACDDLMERVNAFLPQAAPENVEVSYRCSGAGFDGRPVDLLIPEVMVEINNVAYQLIIPSLLGLPRDWVLPSMTSTRTGEDMETVVAP